MANEQGEGRWITINGRHVFIRAGEGPMEAYKRTYPEAYRSFHLENVRAGLSQIAGGPKVEMTTDVAYRQKARDIVSKLHSQLKSQTRAGSSSRSVTTNAGRVKKTHEGGGVLRHLRPVPKVGLCRPKPRPQLPR